MRESATSFVPIEATTKNAIVMPHTNISGHPAGKSIWSDCSVAQQLIPARIKNAMKHPINLNLLSIVNKVKINERFILVDISY